MQTKNLFGFSLEVICILKYISYTVVHVLTRIYLIDFLARQFPHSMLCFISKYVFCILSSCYMTASTNFCMMYTSLYYIKASTKSCMTYISLCYITASTKSCSWRVLTSTTTRTTGHLRLTEGMSTYLYR